jgi:predicted TIM-barrel fold metal-dependent hydrolase
MDFWMRKSLLRQTPPTVFVALLLVVVGSAEDAKQTDEYKRIRASLDATPAIDTHEHLRSFNQLIHFHQAGPSVGVTLHTLLQTSYWTRLHQVPPWPENGSFETWWQAARNTFEDGRANSVYRYLLPAFRDLYGLDFETITDEQARRLNEHILRNYQDENWIKQVIVERANIELMLVDSYWTPFDFKTYWPFEVRVFRVDSLLRGFHASELEHPLEDPYDYAHRRNLSLKTFDDYLALVDRIFAEAKQQGVVCLKAGMAYKRDLHFAKVSKQQASKAFGKPRSALPPQLVRDFEDFMLWRLVELSAQHELPLQIHTGNARIQGSSPMLLLDLIEGNPKTKFILFHGGFPWVGETGAIAFRYRNVWIDSCWLPTLSYSMAKRAYQEWLEIVPTDRILWGGDGLNAESIYGATVVTRQCLAEALTEKVIRGELREEQAQRIGRQILRENALKLFPQLPTSNRNQAMGRAPASQGRD